MSDYPRERGLTAKSGLASAFPFGRLWYGEPNAASNAVGYAKHRNRSHHAAIRVCDRAGNVIETLEHKAEFKEP